MKNNYSEPEFEVISFSENDVVVTSGCTCANETLDLEI